MSELFSTGKCLKCDRDTQEECVDIGLCCSLRYGESCTDLGCHVKEKCDEKEAVCDVFLTKLDNPLREGVKEEIPAGGCRDDWDD